MWGGRAAIGVPKAQNNIGAHGQPPKRHRQTPGPLAHNCSSDKGVVLAKRRGGGICIRREGASEAAPQAVRQAVGGGCQSGWGRVLSVTNTVEAGTWRQGDSGWA